MLAEIKYRKSQDLALQGHCSPSMVVQRALAQFQPARQQSISNDTYAELIRKLIREELAAMQATLTPVTDSATVNTYRYAHRNRTYGREAAL